MPGDRFLELAMAQDRHVLDVLFGDAKEGVTVQAQSGELIYANDRAAQFAGLETGEEMMRAPVSDLVSRFEMIQESGDPFPVDALPGRRVLAGQDAPEVTVGYRIPGTRPVRWSRVNASPIKNDAGEVVWAVNFFLDITDQVRQKEAESIMGRALNSIAGSLEARPDFEALAWALVPEVAGWCAIHLLDEFDQVLTAASVVPDTEESRAMFRAGPQGRIALASDEIQARVIVSGRQEVKAWPWQSAGGPPPELDAPSRPATVLCVPLGIGPRPLGTLTLARGSDDAAFDRADFALVREIAEHIGTALANAMLYEREHETANALRQGLTPSTLPTITGLQFAARYRPLARVGHVGGDFYDLIELDQKRCAVLVGDIEGKGIAAAAAVGVARQTLRATIQLQQEPEIVLHQLNKALQDDETSRMCTIAYLILERLGDGFAMQVTLAGHPPPVVIRADGQIDEVGSPSPPVGVLEQVTAQSTNVTLAGGDTVVVYTDGLSRRDLAPPETVKSLVERQLSESVEGLVDGILEEFTAEVEQVHDDIVVLAFRVV